MNRRELLTYAGAAGALSLLPAPRLARAATTGPKRRLIMVYARGGWDPTVVLDPKTQSAQIDVTTGARKTFGNLPVFSDPVNRPNVETYFTKHAANTAIVRGISVASVVHAECQKRMATGTREESNADMGAIVAREHGNDLPLPYLILGEVAYSAAGVERARATRGATGYNKKRVDDFAASIERSEKLKPLRASFGTRGRALSLPDQVDLAIEALQGGISQSAMLSTRRGWDDHDDITDQGPSVELTFTGLTYLMDQLAARSSTMTTGAKMIDDTVVLVFSEFGRTPRMNANGGKDHWPVTAAMVMGAGVSGGRAYGATNGALEAQTVDFATGAVSGAGRTLMSSHFVAGVLSACRVDPASHLGPTEVFDAFVA